MIKVEHAKRDVFILILGVSLVVVGLVLGLTAREQKIELTMQKEKSAESIELLAGVLDDSQLDYNLANEYIMNHLPYEIVSSTLYSHSHTASKVEDVELAKYTVGQLYNAIRNRDINDFLAVFQTSSYIEYLNKFDSYEETLSSLDQYFQKILKDDTLSTISMMEDNENTYTLYFSYQDGTEIEVPVGFELEKDSHSKAEYAVIHTGIDEVFTYFN
ncbi:hypothetical protein [Ureibacillus chungkukjangi]|uniref:hypothetical protein n=1 Tax=Ureibacillus chungkukjangi TaxID=1202712 RepID=UPI0012903C75|nr:hypothetical protein [Ureibacillus chungkukjangi]